MFQNTISIIGDINISENFFVNSRVYGTILLIILTLVEFYGSKFVVKINPILLVCVLTSIIGVFIGIVRSAFFQIDLE